MRETLRSLTRSQVGGFGLQVLFAVVVPLLVLPLALQSTFLAAGFAFALLILISSAFFGMEHTGGAILLAAFAASPLDDLRPIPALSFVAVSDLLFAIAFVVLAPAFIGRSLRVPSLFVLGGIGMLSVGVISSLGDENVAASFNHLLRFAVGALGLAILLSLWQANRRWTIAAASAYMIGNGVNVIASYLKSPLPDGRYYGLTTHPNVMGLCAALGFALTPFLFRTVDRHRWLVIVGSMLCFWGIWISGSRAALAAALAIALLYPFLARSVIAGLGVAAFGFVAVYLVDWAARQGAGANALSRALGGGSAAGSDQAREDLARVAIDHFLAHPVLGSGLGTVMEAHSIYLQILAAIGLVGAAFFAIALAALVRPLFLLPKPYDLLAAPALTYAMAGTVSPLLWDRYIWCVLAFALMAPRLAAEHAEDEGSEAGSAAEAPPASMTAERWGAPSDP